MVRMMFVCAVVCVNCCMAYTYTNVTELVGNPLSSTEISRLPTRDSSTPDTVFLGTIRSLQQGDLTGLYYHFETNYLFEVTGFHALGQIPEALQASFRSVMVDGCFSNLTISAYSAVPTNQAVKISALIRENFSARIVNESLNLVVSKFGTRWEIISYEE